MAFKINVQTKEMEFKGMKVGTIVEPCYHKGFWEVVHIDLGGIVTNEVKDKHFRWDSRVNPGDKMTDPVIVTIKKVYENDGSPAKRKRKLQLLSNAMYIMDEQRFNGKIYWMEGSITIKENEIKDIKTNIASIEALKKTVLCASESKSEKTSTSTVETKNTETGK